MMAALTGTPNIYDELLDWAESSDPDPHPYKETLEVTDDYALELLDWAESDPTPENQRNYKRMLDASVNLSVRSSKPYRDAKDDLDRQTIINAERKKYGLEPIRDTSSGFGEQLGKEAGSLKALERKVPIAGHGAKAADLMNVKRAAERVAQGHEYVEDIQLLADFQEQLADDARNKTLGGTIGSILPNTIQFGLEMGLMGPGVKLAELTSVRAAAAAIAKGIPETAAQLATGYTPAIAEAYIRQRVPELTPAVKGEKLTMAVIPPGESEAQSLADAVADTAIEVVSEKSGRVLAVLGRPVRAAAGKMGIESPLSMGAREFLSRFGVQGIPEEIAEEELGYVMRALSDKGLGTQMGATAPTWKELLAVGATTVVLGGGAYAADKLAVAPLKIEQKLAARGQRLAEEQLAAEDEEAPPDTGLPTKEEIISPQGASNLWANDPETAQAMVDDLRKDRGRKRDGDAPSAKIFEDAGFAGDYAMNRDERRRFAELLEANRPKETEDAAVVSDDTEQAPAAGVPVPEGEVAGAGEVLAPAENPPLPAAPAETQPDVAPASIETSFAAVGERVSWLNAKGEERSGVVTRYDETKREVTVRTPQAMLVTLSTDDLLAPEPRVTAVKSPAAVEGAAPGASVGPMKYSGPVYRGQQQGSDPKKANLTRIRSLHEVLGDKPPDAPDPVPLEYYTENRDVADDYSKQDESFLSGLRSRGVPNPEEVFESLIGRKPLSGKGKTSSYSISGIDILDLSGLGEKPEYGNIMDALAEIESPNLSRQERSDLDNRLGVSLSGVYPSETIPIWRLLRNDPRAGDEAKDKANRFVDWLKGKGFKGVRYAEQGTRHLAILSEYSPFSAEGAAPGASGQPIGRFHGTSTPISKLEEYTYGTQNIYGQGLYTTDNYVTAKSYTKKGKGGKPTIYRVVEIGPQKILNLEHPAPPEISKAILDGGGWPSEVFRDLIDRPLREWYDEIRGSSKHEGMSADEVQEYFEGVTMAAMQSGYTGSSHVGGRFVGKTPHNVVIYFEPSKSVKLMPVDVAKLGAAPGAVEPQKPVEVPPIMADEMLPAGLKIPINELSTEELKRRIKKASPFHERYVAELERRKKAEDEIEGLYSKVAPGPRPPEVAPAPLPGGTPLKTKELQVKLGKTLRKRILRRGLPSSLHGMYIPSNGGVFLRRAQDIATVAHEIAHAMDDLLGLGPVAQKKDPSNLRSHYQPDKLDPELLELAKRGSPEKTLPLRRAEGVAVFVRDFLVNPDEARRQSPRFAQHFKDAIPSDLWKDLDDFSQQIRRWAGMSATEKIASHVKSVTDRPMGVTEKVAELFKKQGYGFETDIWDEIGEKLSTGLTKAVKAYRWGATMVGLDLEAMQFKDNFEKMVRSLAYGGGDINFIAEHGFPDAENGEPLSDQTPFKAVVDAVPRGTKDQVERHLRVSLAKMIGERTIEKVEQRDAAAKRVSEILVELEGEIDPEAKKELLAEMKKLMQSVGYAGEPGGFAQWVTQERDFLAGIGFGLFSDVSVAKQAIEEYRNLPDADRAVVDAFTKAYRGNADTVLRFLVNWGYISQEEYDAIKDGNEFYVAFHRIVDSPSEELLERFKGSTRMLRDPTVSLLKANMLAMRTAAMNRAHGLFLEPFRAKRSFQNGRVRDLSQVTYQVSSVEYQRMLQDKGDKLQVLRVRNKGVMEYWVFPDAGVFTSVRRLGRSPHTFRVWGVVHLARFSRFMISHGPQFLIRNIQRDSLNRFMVTKTGGIESVLPKLYTKEGQAEYIRHGGGMTPQYMIDDEHYYQFMRNALRERMTDANHILVWPHRILEGWTRFASWGEMVGRMREYETATNQAKEKLGYDDYNARLYGAAQARELLDFADAGYWVSVLNAHVPFTNAMVRGLMRAAQSAKDDPFKLVVRMMIATFPMSLLEYYMAASRDDEKWLWNLPAYQRDLFWNFRVSGVHVMIPKPFELGLFGSMLSRTIASERGDAGALDGFWTSVKNSFLPDEILLTPQPVKLTWELITDYDSFRDRYIVPPYEQGKAVEYRKGAEKGSWVGKAIAHAFNWTGANADPREIDHAITSLAGGPGRLLVEAGKDDGLKRATMTASGMVTRDSTWGARDVQWVLNWLERNDRANDRVATGLKDMVRYAEEVDGEEGDRARGAAVKHASELRRMIAQGKILPKGK